VGAHARRWPQRLRDRAGLRRCRRDRRLVVGDRALGRCDQRRACPRANRARPRCVTIRALNRPLTILVPVWRVAGRGDTDMNVIALVSCKTGTGKTTLTAQLASQALAQSRRCLVIDADPRGSFALYNSRRAEGALPAARAGSGLDRQLAIAEFLGYEWVLI